MRISASPIRSAFTSFLCRSIIFCFPVLLISFPTLSGIRLYAHDTADNHFMLHKWFHDVFLRDSFPFWFSSSSYSFPTSTLQLGQWWHSPYIYLLSALQIPYTYFSLQYEFLFWRILAYVGALKFASSYLHSPLLRIAAAAIYISNGIVASSDPEILYLQAFAIIPWILHAITGIVEYRQGAFPYLILSISSLFWFGYHGMGLTLPAFILFPLLIYLFRSSFRVTLWVRIRNVFLLCIGTMCLLSIKISDTLAVPLYGVRLGPDRSSSDGLFLLSQIWGVLFPNPIFLLSDTIPVSVQSLYMGLVPIFVLFIFGIVRSSVVLYSCNSHRLFLFRPLCYVLFGVSLFGALGARLFEHYMLYIVCIVTSLLLLLTWCNRALTMTAEQLQALSTPWPTFSSIKFYILLSYGIIGFISGTAWFGAIVFHTLIPTMLLTRYQSCNLIYTVLSISIISLSFFEHSRAKMQLLYLFRTHIHVALCLAIVVVYSTIHNIVTLFPPPPSIVFVSSSLILYLSLLAIYVSSIFVVFVAMRITGHSSQSSIGLMLIASCLLSIAIYVVNISNINKTPLLFSTLTFPLDVHIMVNVVHFTLVLSSISIVWNKWYFGHRALPIWVLIIVLDIGASSVLYVSHSTILIGNPRSSVTEIVPIAPTIRAGSGKVYDTLQVPSYTPGLWAFPDVMPHVRALDDLDSSYSLFQSLILTSEDHYVKVLNEQDIMVEDLFPRMDTGFTCVLNDQSRTVHITINKWIGSRINLLLDSPCSFYLIFVDSWAPGWSTTIDGVALPTLRANSALRAIRYPGGKHEISSQYYPYGFTILLPITILTLVSCVGLMIKGHIIRFATAIISIGYRYFPHNNRVVL